MKQNKYQLGNEITSIEQSIKLLQEALVGKREYLQKLQQGGFSDDLFQLKSIQDYLKDFNGNCFGYIGSERPLSTDKFIEKNWNHSKVLLASFLCSKQGRYLIDNLTKDKIKNLKILKQYEKEFIENYAD